MSDSISLATIQEHRAGLVENLNRLQANLQKAQETTKAIEANIAAQRGAIQYADLLLSQANQEEPQEVAPQEGAAK